MNRSPSKRHGARIGPDGCTVVDLFSPIRHDLIEAAGGHYKTSGEEEKQLSEDKDPHEQLRGFLASSGIRVPLEELKKLPLDLLARYVYERQCITMGQLRKVLKMSKDEAKALLREWKHGDDHSEASLQRTMERMIVLPGDLKLFRPE